MVFCGCRVIEHEFESDFAVREYYRPLALADRAFRECVVVSVTRLFLEIGKERRRCEK